MTVSPTIQPAKRDDWETPHDLFDQLWQEAGGFDCDPACAPGQYTATRILEAGGLVCYAPGTEIDDEALRNGVASIDGLASYWSGDVFLNPPYGRGLGLWIAKAYKEISYGRADSVTALLPSYTGTKWWQGYILTRVRFTDRYLGVLGPYVSDVRFLPGRLRFVGAEGHARMANAIVTWRRS